MEIIDCHPHVYSADVATFPTIAEPVDPIEPASAEDLKAKMDAAQPPVHRAVFIQTSTYYGFDNRYIAHCSTTHSAWATGVATLNPDDPRELQGEGCYFLVYVQLFEKHGTLIERNTALIEKVSLCSTARASAARSSWAARPSGQERQVSEGTFSFLCNYSRNTGL
eukprot:SAG31_NODE_2215_length_6172_cov_3.268730_2_plen_166_part_00